MEKILFQDIKKEAEEKANQYHLYHNHLELSHQRNLRRLNTAPPKEVRVPDEWSQNKRFNPFYVLKNNKSISRSVSIKLLNGTYLPNPPFIKRIPKKGGGVREVNIYEIPDSAVSDRFYYNLLSKNKHRFSSMSYAYRNDRNVHFAIQDISSEINLKHRVYIAEFDFKDFFGSISHEYLFNLIDSGNFLISELEKKVIKSFLVGYNRGIPQGTSISLFLANLVCIELDRNFEELGIKFARYADDTIIWSNDYIKIVKAFDVISNFSIKTGVKINFRKSEGISLLHTDGVKSELQNAKNYFEFLGYKISCKNVGIKDASIKKMKKQISYILYKNLLQPLKVNPINIRNIPMSGMMDKDYITAIMQIRRYLYGNMTEETLKKYLDGTYKRLNFKGIMSFYPLINDKEQMELMDRWIVSTIIEVLKKRKSILLDVASSFDSNQFPYDCNKNELISKSRRVEIFNKKGLAEIPSFMRIYDAIKKGLINEGIERVMHPNSNRYYNI